MVINSGHFIRELTLIIVSKLHYLLIISMITVKYSINLTKQEH